MTAVFAVIVAAIFALGTAAVLHSNPSCRPELYDQTRYSKFTGKPREVRELRAKCTGQ